MLTKRLIACLDVKDGRVVKGVRFGNLIGAGDCAELARRYDAEGIDEVVILDVSATIEGRRVLLDVVSTVADQVFIPVTVGGGVRTVEDAEAVLRAGADKISVNSAALERPSLISEIASRFGSQAVVVAIDAKRQGHAYEVFARSGSTVAHRDAIEWAAEAERAGAGEILLTSMDRDGTRDGFDCSLTAAASAAVRIPVIASGGAGTRDHFVDVFTAGHADAALAASVFHFSEHGVRDVKQRLRERGVPVRLPC